MRRRTFLGAIGPGLVGLRMSWGASLDGSVFVERRSWAMGQPVHLQLFAASESAGLEAAQRTFAELRRVEAALSLFDETSDLCEVNRQAGARAVRVGDDLLTVLAAGLGFEADTGGAFNPAVEPLMRAWGFHASRTRGPTEADLSAACQAVRAARIVVEGGAVRLPVRGTMLDLGGIGVGYGLDRGIDVLRRAGIRRAFLDVSGDCFALGAPPGQRGWSVGVEDPHHPGQALASTRLRDLAVATSSNSVATIRYGRAVRGHVMNTATGWPATARKQVTVVGRTGLAADALSTAMLVSGAVPPGVLRHYAV